MDPAERMRKMPPRIIAEFLTGSNLRKMFSHLCNNASGQVTDPISDTAVMMLTCPVQLILTEVGVALFKDRPTSLFPFTHMDDAQRYFVEEIVRDCLLHCDVAVRHVQAPVHAGESNAALPFYHIHHHAVVQMGGGCILYMHSKHPAETLDNNFAGKKKKMAMSSATQQQQNNISNNHNRLPATEVLKSMCDCIFSSTKYGDADVRLAICSILLQRIVGMCGLVTRDDQRTVHGYCEEMVKEWRSRDVLEKQGLGI